MVDCTIKQELLETDKVLTELVKAESPDAEQTTSEENVNFNSGADNSRTDHDEHVPEKDEISIWKTDEFLDESDGFGQGIETFRKYPLRKQKPKAKIKKEKSKPLRIRSKYDEGDEDDLKCSHCKFQSQSRTGLLNHLRIHQGQKETGYTCSFCCEEFDTNNELIAHRSRPDHIEHMFTCKQCPLAFSEHMDYLLHMVEHSEGPPYRCKECPKRLKSKWAFKIHIGTHFDTSIECQKCGKFYKGEIRYRVHLKTHNEVHKCGECGKECKSAFTLKYHMVSHTGVKLYQCIYCGKGFASTCMRKIHTRVHTNERPFQCKVCQRGFRQYIDLKRHVSVHHSTERPVFECDLCNVKYKYKASLEIHLRTHSKTDLLPCSECGKEFTIIANLRSHMINMHTDVRPYECKVCQMNFKMKCDLLRHNRCIRHKNNVYGATLKQGQDRRASES